MKSWEKFVKKIEKEEEIKNIKTEYYAKIDSEISEKINKQLIIGKMFVITKEK